MEFHRVAPVSSIVPGTTLGHFEVLERIGAGGFGEVYRAKDTRLGRDVAIKVLPQDFLESEERSVRFEREAHALASLNHPNVAAIHSFEEIEVASRDYSKEKPVSDDVFKAYHGLYAYDKRELNARVEETSTIEAATVERVSFDAAYGGERVTAYLLLPIPYASSGVLGARSAPLEPKLPAGARALPKIEIDQGLIGDGRLAREGPEVRQGVLVESNRDLPFEVFGVRVTPGARKVIMFLHWLPLVA